MKYRLILLVILTGRFFLSSAGDGMYCSKNHDEVLRDYVADQYQAPSMNIGDPEKYYWPKIMARFEKYGVNDSLSNQWIEQLKNHSPFHFTLLGMARLMSLYPDAPAIKKNRLLLLKKIFMVTDSYNAWTGEGTENHINMSRTSGYIFALQALDFPEEFPDAPRRLAEMEQWIVDWSHNVFKVGTGEWNSGIYEVYNMAGWLNVYDFSPKPGIRAAARAVLDYYTAELSLHDSWGVTGGAEMRGAGAEDKSSNATAYLLWYWFSESDLPAQGFSGNEYIQIMHAATSHYKPEMASVVLARKERLAHSWYINSKPSYLLDKPSFVHQFFYADSMFTLGSCVSPYGGWTGGTSQIVAWKLVVKGKENEPPLQVSGNGGNYRFLNGKALNPFTQVVQYKNVLVQMTKTPVNADDLKDQVYKIVDQWKEQWQSDFSKRYPGDHKPQVVNTGYPFSGKNISVLNLPEHIEWQSSAGRCYLNLGHAYVLVSFISKADSAKTGSDSGRLLLQDEADPGSICGFILEIADASEYPCFDEFIAKASTASINRSQLQEATVLYRSLAGDHLKATYEDTGTFTEATFDWGYGAQEPLSLMTEPPFRQPPWPSGKGYGRIPRLWVNGKEQKLTGVIPVFSGPGLDLENSILTRSCGDHRLVTDYSGLWPKFSEFFVPNPQ